MSLWVNIDSFTSNGYFIDSASGRFILGTSAGSGELRYYSVASYWIDTGYTLSTNTWYHIVITEDGTNIRLYIDGDWKATTTSTEISLGGTTMLGSRYTHNQDYLDGTMDEVGIWERALTSAEITQLYNGGTGISWTNVSTVNCIFSGYVKDESGTALVGANVTIWNQYDISESYENTTIAGGVWSLNIANSTNTYMAGAYYNNTLIGQLKPYISGTC